MGSKESVCDYLISKKSLRVISYACHPIHRAVGVIPLKTALAAIIIVMPII